MNQRTADKSAINRRSALKLGLGALCLFLPSTAMAATSAVGKRTISFDNLHTGEKLKTVYWTDGL